MSPPSACDVTVLPFQCMFSHFISVLQTSIWFRRICDINTKAQIQGVTKGKHNPIIGLNIIWFVFASLIFQQPRWWCYFGSEWLFWLFRIFRWLKLYYHILLCVTAWWRSFEYDLIIREQDSVQTSLLRLFKLLFIDLWQIVLN